MKNYWTNIKKASLDDCIGVAARIWCDKEFSNITMDAEACLKIADMLHNLALSQGKAK